MRHFTFCFLFLLVVVPMFSQDHILSAVRFPAGMHSQAITDVQGNETDCRPDSLLEYEYAGDDSFLVSKTIAHYYSNNGALHHYGLLNGSLRLISIDSVAYNSQGYPSLSYGQTYDPDSNRLRPDYRYLYYPRSISTFDSIIASSYSTTTQTLEPYSKDLYHYNSNNQYVGLDRSIWSSSLQIWQPSRRETSTFTATGRIDYIISENWYNGNYSLAERRQYSYDTRDSLVSIITIRMFVGIPMFSFKEEFIYDEVAKSTLINQYEWDVNLQQWIFRSYRLIDYDLENRLEASEYAYWFSLDTFGRRNEYYYLDNSGCRSLAVTYNTMNGATWQLATNTYYYYSDGMVATQELEKQDRWLAYPNPARDGFWLEAPVGSTVQILDLQGEIFYNGRATGKDYIALHGLHGLVLVRVGATARLLKVGW